MANARALSGASLRRSAVHPILIQIAPVAVEVAPDAPGIVPQVPRYAAAVPTVAVLALGHRDAWEEHDA